MVFQNPVGSFLIPEGHWVTESVRALETVE